MKRKLLVRRFSIKRGRKLIKRYKDYRFTIRVMILHAVKRRPPLRIIAELFDVSIKSIRRYIERFNKYGFKGLLDKPRPRRRMKVRSDSIQILLELGPKHFGYEFEYWTVKQLNVALREKLGAEYSYNYLYRLIRRHGYSLKKPCPIN